jgi:hypothetical protein
LEKNERVEEKTLIFVVWRAQQTYNFNFRFLFFFVGVENSSTVCLCDCYKVVWWWCHFHLKNFHTFVFFAAYFACPTLAVLIYKKHVRKRIVGKIMKIKKDGKFQGNL